MIKLHRLSLPFLLQNFPIPYMLFCSVFLNKARSICIMLLVCIFSDLTFWYWMINWRILFSHYDHSLVACSSLVTQGDALGCFSSLFQHPYIQRYMWPSPLIIKKTLFETNGDSSVLKCPVFQNIHDSEMRITTSIQILIFYKKLWANKSNDNFKKKLLNNYLTSHKIVSLEIHLLLNTIL